MNHQHEYEMPPLHTELAGLAVECSEIIVDLAHLSGRLAQVQHRLWHLTHDTDPSTVEDAT